MKDQNFFFKKYIIITFTLVQLVLMFHTTLQQVIQFIIVVFSGIFFQTAPTSSYTVCFFRKNEFFAFIFFTFFSDD